MSTWKTDWKDGDIVNASDMNRLEGSGKSHASQHASNGADPITPASIGAVSKVGDTMTENLVIRKTYDANGTNNSRIILGSTQSGSKSTFAENRNNAAAFTRTDAISNDLNKRSLLIKNVGFASVNAAVTFESVVDGVVTEFVMLHSGNLQNYLGAAPASLETE